MKKQKTILITGVAGFIGSNTAKKLLSQGAKIIGIDDFNNYYDVSLKKNRIKKFIGKHKNFKLYKADICEYKKLKNIFSRHKIDKICHLAAYAGVRYSISHPMIYEKVNIQGTINLLEFAKKIKIKNFVFASSSSVYGNSRKEKIKEKEETSSPISLYGATKKTDELIAYYYHTLYKFPITALRYFTVYGPWGRPDMALFKFADLMIKDKKIPVYNYGKLKRDFTYIDDIVDGTIAALNKNYPFEIFNLGSSRTVKLEYFIDLIEKNLGITAKKNYLPMQKGDVLKSCADISKARKKLKFNPKVEIEYGVKNFIKWYKKYYDI